MQNPINSLAMSNSVSSRGSSSPHADKQPGLTLNQKILGEVVAHLNGQNLIKLNGNVYPIQSSHPLKLGSYHLIRVTSLLPQLELTLLAATAQQKSVQALPVTMISTETRLKLTQKNTGKLAGLFQILQEIDSDTARNLPIGAVNDFRKILKNLINYKELSNPTRLRSGANRCGVFMESGQQLPASDAGELEAGFSPDNDLKYLLTKALIEISNAEEVTPLDSDSAGHAPVLEAALYSSINPIRNNTLDEESALQKVIRAVQDGIDQITHNQRHCLRELEQDSRRWFFVMPVNFPAQVKELPLSIFKRSGKDGSTHSQPLWGAEFTLELENMGQVSVEIDTSNAQVNVKLEATEPKIANFLDAGSTELNRTLSRKGLALGDFGSEAHYREQADGG